METTLYPGTALDDDSRIYGIYNSHSQNSMMKKEINLNLDKSNNNNNTTDHHHHHHHGHGILNSPDLGLLKLASPDLERLIIQSNGMVTTTPTSSQFLYPKSASDEQEFAEGFVKALEDLHKQNQLQSEAASCVSTAGGDRLDLIGGGSTNNSSVSSNNNNNNNNGGGGLQASDLPVYTTLNGYGAAASPLGTTVNYSTDTIPFPPPPPSHLLNAQQQAAAAAVLSRLQQQSHQVHHGAGLKDEPQTVPDMQIGGFGCSDSPPLSPIDMDNQERIKAERKKLRNRIAASKCRKRKLERISRLEDKVKGLKTQNTELASTASVLREQVAQLKQKVMNHVSNGCQLLPNQVQAY